MIALAWSGLAWIVPLSKRNGASTTCHLGGNTSRLCNRLTCRAMHGLAPNQCAAGEKGMEERHVGIILDTAVSDWILRCAQ